MLAIFSAIPLMASFFPLIFLDTGCMVGFFFSNVYLQKLIRLVAINSL